MKYVMSSIAGAALIGLVAATTPVLAQMCGSTMGGQQHEGMGSGDTGSDHMMSRGHMMNDEMMQNMTGMMQQMDGMMQKMTHTMGHQTVTEHAKMQDMAKVMRDMAAQMQEMAAHMEKGSMDSATAKKMQERMDATGRSIETFQKESK